MTLSGAIAQRRPDVDQLAATVGILVGHDRVEIDKTGLRQRVTYAPMASSGRVDRETGMYTATANRLTEAERRAAGLRRNGQPRRRAA